MAQAEFERNKQQGGFDSTSYRAAEPESGARVLTPLQQKLAGLEKALPKALRSRALAFVLAAAVLAAGVVGIGGVKLRARANEAAGWYTVGAPGDNDHNLNEELTQRANTAANVITPAPHPPASRAARRPRAPRASCPPRRTRPPAARAAARPTPSPR